MVLDRLLELLGTGESSALVVRGEAGIGKSALLSYLAERAAGCRVARAVGVQSEMELPFAALHQLCAPMLNRLEGVPKPQREALGTAFGLRAGPVPDQFLIGLAVLSLLAEAARKRPLVCVIDDAQWLDRASRQVLAFVARRLGAESVVMAFAVREPTEELAGVPELVLDGLHNDDARTLLRSAVGGPLDVRVGDRIVAEMRGNPLALLELPRGLSPAELAGGFGLPTPLPDQIEQSFRRRLEPLTSAARWLLLVAATEAVGDPVLVWEATRTLGKGADHAAAAEVTHLVEFGARVRFRHPLVRAAIYHAAPPADRQSAHGALADATDPELDPDRRAWHRAHAAVGPDEDVAAELERSARRAQARAGLAAAAAFLECAASLTPDVSRRAQRTLAAAQAELDAGAPERALDLVAVVQGWPLDDFLSATVERLQGRIAAAVSGGHAAPPLLLNAAKRFEALDRALARETYLEALSAAMFAGPLVEHEVAKTAWTVRAAPASPTSARAAELLLDGFALQITEGARAACPSLRQALTVFEREDVSMADELRWLWLASLAAVALWDDVAWHELARRQVQLAREQGALTLLPLALNLRIVVDVHQGRLSEAASLSEEVRAIAAATRTHLTPYGSLALAAWRGEETDATRLIDANLEDAAARGEGIGVIVAWWARAVLFNGLGRYDEACAAAELAAVHTEVPGASNWVLAELVEAAARSGRTKIAVDALHRLSHLTVPVGTDWALGVEARCRALLADGDGAEGLYREAIDRLGRSRIRPELARAYLLYGEWLRRENRRLDARDQLRAASRLFTSMGTEAFAERAARELLATGETARKRILETRDQLTPQETQIARLASDGLSNPEIGTRMFLSPRTIEYHLHKIFGKLGVKSRAQLSRALSIANAERLIPYSGAQLD